jgi:hypothetical protein
MADLHAFINTTSNFVELFFKPDDQMFAHIYAEARDGKTTMFACPMADANEERMFRLGIPAKLRRERYRRWCFFCEAWTAEYTAGRHVILPEQRADRMEIVTFAAEDGTTGEKLMASRQIFRAPGQPAKLLPLVFRQMTGQFVMAEGR